MDQNNNSVFTLKYIGPGLALKTEQGTIKRGTITRIGNCIIVVDKIIHDAETNDVRLLCSSASHDKQISMSIKKFLLYWPNKAS